MEPVNNRETETIKTANGETVVLYASLNGGEMRQIQRMMLEGASANDIFNSQDTQQNLFDKLPASSLFDIQDKVLSMLAVSVNGDTENPSEKVLSLKPDDTNEIMGIVIEHISGNRTKKKSESQPLNTQPEA